MITTMMRKRQSQADTDRRRKYVLFSAPAELGEVAKHLGMYEIRRELTSRVGDVSVLTDEELAEIIRE